MDFNIKIDVHHHHESELFARLHALKLQGDKLMALSQEIKDLTAKIDAATSAVASRIDALTAKITNSMTDAEVADVKAGLQSEVDRLTALGTDPTNPVP